MRPRSTTRTIQDPEVAARAAVARAAVARVVVARAAAARAAAKAAAAKAAAAKVAAPSEVIEVKVPQGKGAGDKLLLQARDGRCDPPTTGVQLGYSSAALCKDGYTNAGTPREVYIKSVGRAPGTADFGDYMPHSADGPDGAGGMDMDGEGGGGGLEGGGGEGGGEGGEGGGGGGEGGGEPTGNGAE